MQKNQVVKLNQDAYDKIAADFFLKREHRLDELKFLIKYVKKGEEVLDLGCGSGRLYELFSDLSLKYVGVDQSREQLKMAKKKFPKAKFIKAEMTKVPFENKKFDKVFCIAAFHHLLDGEQLLKALQEMKRVLRKNGKIIMTNWNLLGDWRIAKMDSGLYIDIGDNNFEIPWRNSDGIVMANRYYHAFSPRELTKLAKQVGLKMEKQYYEWHGKRSDKKNGANIVSVLSI